MQADGFTLSQIRALLVQINETADSGGRVAPLRRHLNSILVSYGLICVHHRNDTYAIVVDESGLDPVSALRAVGIPE